MGGEFVARKSSVWGKKSDTKPSLFTSRPFSEPTREDNTVSKKELPKDIPPPNYIFAKMGFNAPQPVVQREEENSQEKEPEQEADVNLKSDVSADDEENSDEQAILGQENQEKVAGQNHVNNSLEASPVNKESSFLENDKTVSNNQKFSSTFAKETKGDNLSISDSSTQASET